MEILSQHQAPIHAIFVPIGGGGLAAGVAAYVKAVRPEIKVIGVQTEDSCAMAHSIEAGERVTLNEVGLFSDGTAVKLVGEETFRLCSEYLDDVLPVEHRRALRRDQGRVPGHPQRAGTGRLARRRGREAVCGARRHREADADRDHVGREHELRPHALRRRARRSGRSARSGVRRDDSRRARQLQALLRTGRHAQRHRIQLPDRRCEARRISSSACRSRRRSESAQIAWRVRGAWFRDRRSDVRRTLEAAHPLHGRRPLAARAATNACSASSFPSGRAR